MVRVSTFSFAPTLLSLLSFTFLSSSCLLLCYIPLADTLLNSSRGLSLNRHSHDDDTSQGSDDNDDEDDSDTDDDDNDDQRRHEQKVILPRPSAPTPGLSPTRDSEGSSSAMSTRLPNTPATPARPLASISPISPMQPNPIYGSSRLHHYYNRSNQSSPSKRSIRPLPTPPTSPRRSTDPEPESGSDSDSVDEHVTELERLKALRKLHSASTLDEAEIPKILSTQKGVRRVRPLPAVPGLVE